MKKWNELSTVHNCIDISTEDVSKQPPSMTVTSRSDKKLMVYKTNIQTNIQFFLVKNYNIIKLIYIDLYKIIF